MRPNEEWQGASERELIRIKRYPVGKYVDCPCGAPRSTRRLLTEQLSFRSWPFQLSSCDVAGGTGVLPMSLRYRSRRIRTVALGKYSDSDCLCFLQERLMEERHYLAPLGWRALRYQKALVTLDIQP